MTKQVSAWKRLSISVGVSLLALAGCTSVPAGVDKNLVDDWVMLKDAKVPEPSDGACWSSTSRDVYALLRTPALLTQAPCDMSHVAETVKVGHYTGALAGGGTPPLATDLTDVYTSCVADITKYLGASWLTGRVRPLIVSPTTNQWRGGARFYRCDIAALRSEEGTLEPRTKTLKDTLQPNGELLLACSNQVGTGDSWTDLTPTPCTSPHDSEFMGVVPSASPTFPTDQATRRTAFSAGCQSLIRSVTKEPDSNLAKADIRFGYWMTGDEDDWKLGEHNARCYLFVSKKITRSLRNAGNTPI